jgi:hypothetical protein
MWKYAVRAQEGATHLAEALQLFPVEEDRWRIGGRHQRHLQASHLR